MENLVKIKEWRSEEIAKIYLLKSEYKLIISNYPTPLFDFFIQLKEDQNVKFAVEVKTKAGFFNKMRGQLSSLGIYRDAEMINIPVLLFRIDEVNETGEIDFLVFPSINENKLLVRDEFNFEILNQQTLKTKIEIIKQWFQRRNQQI